LSRFISVDDEVTTVFIKIKQTPVDTKGKVIANTTVCITHTHKKTTTGKSVKTN